MPSGFACLGSVLLTPMSAHLCYIIIVIIITIDIMTITHDLTGCKTTKDLRRQVMCEESIW